MKSSKNWWFLVGVCLMAAITFVDLVMISTLLGAIQSHLFPSYRQLQWVFNIYMLTLGIFIVTMGRLGDRIGVRKTLFFGMGMFALSSLSSGLAQNVNWLIVSRAMQGFSSAIIFPCSLTAIRRTFPSHQIRKVIRIWNSVAMIGFAFGPTFAGLIANFFNWRGTFLICIPFTLLSLIISIFTIDLKYEKKEKVEIDWWGFIFLLISSTCLISAILQSTEWSWTSPKTFGLLVLAIIAVILFIFVEMTTEKPLINLTWFKKGIFTGSVVAACSIICFVLTALFLTPLYLHNIKDYSLFSIGFLLLPITLPSILLSPFVGHLVDKWGFKKPVFLGMFFLVFASFLQAFFNHNSVVGQLLISFAILGIAWVLILIPTKIEALKAVLKEEAEVIMGTLLTLEYLISALGFAILGSIFRFKQQTVLINNLQSAQIPINKERSLLIQNLLAHPLQLKKALGDYSPTLDYSILPIFQKAFLSGFEEVQWTCVGIFTLAFLLVFYFYRSKNI